jgi:hypothetical protein
MLPGTVIVSPTFHSFSTHNLPPALPRTTANTLAAIHSVDTSHNGTSDSSVLYIPATPLTPANAAYLARQRANFLRGIPPPVFPGGVCEEHHVGRGGEKDLEGESKEARRSVGVERWDVEEGKSEGVKRVLEEGNKALGF